MSYILTALGAFIFGALIVAVLAARRASRDAVTIVDAQTQVAHLSSRATSAESEVARLHKLLTTSREVNDRLVRKLSGMPASDFPEAG